MRHKVLLQICAVRALDAVLFAGFLLILMWPGTPQWFAWGYAAVSVVVFVRRAWG